MADNKRPLVLYGAGNRALTEIAVLKNKGLNPVCVCDVDANKHDTLYLGLEVLSLDRTRERYGEFDIYVTPTEKGEIFEYLLAHKINKERIVNYIAMEKYLSCLHLEYHLSIMQFQLFFCCSMSDEMKKNTPSYIWFNDPKNVTIEYAVSRWIELRYNAIHALKNGIPSKCDGCSSLTEDWWPIEKKVETVHYCFCNEPCQLRCVYCNSTKKTINEYQRQFMEEFDYKRFVKALEEQRLLTDETCFNIASGEISINPRKNEILSAIEKYRLMLDTNAVVFDKQIAELASRPGSSLCISLDAGTRETYNKIKGMDVFITVCENIKRYANCGAKIYIKYIVLPQNCEDIDIHGFMNEVLKIKNNVSCLILSSDIHKTSSHSDEQINGAAKLISAAKQFGINTTIYPTYTSTEIKNINLIAESFT